MAIDFTRYQPPGIYTEEVGSPQLGVRSSVPTAVGIFGLTLGFRKYIESVKINPDTDPDTPAVNRTLAKKGIKTESIKVVNPNSGQVYAVGTDYTVKRISVGEDLETGTRDDLYTIQRVITAGHIQVGDTVQLEYQYTDPSYFEVYPFYDYDDLSDAYGTPFDAAGNIQSELTLAARFAFMNGASTVIAVAVDPEDPEVPTMADYSKALDKFRDENNISIIVPATGATPIHQLVLQHVTAQSNNMYERRAILGFDGVVQPITSAQRIAAAQAISDKRVALVSPDSFDYFAPELNKVIQLGSQYMAASLAGWAVNHNAAWPLTRKRMLGWQKPTVQQRDGEKNLESQNGLMVVELTRQNLVQVRHGVTTDNSDMLAAEWNIIGQGDVLVYRIRDYLNADDLIGQPIYDTTLINVKASAESALQSLKRDEIIVDYQNLKVRQLEAQPDVVEVRFEWKPAFPLNYIVVRYSITTTTGEVQQTSL